MISRPIVIMFITTGGSLADVLAEAEKNNKYLSECEAGNVLIQVAKGLRYIHSQNLVHLDIKPGMFLRS